MRRLLLLSGPSFDPRSFGGLVLDLNALTVSGSDGDEIASVADRSGAGNNATADATKRPLLKVGVLGGRKALRFDGVNDCLVTGTVALGGTTGITVMAVMASAASSGIVLETSANLNNVTDAFGLMIHASSGRPQMSSKGDVGYTSRNSDQDTTTGKVVIALVDKALATAETSICSVNGVNTGAQPNNSNNTNGFGDYAWNIGSRSNGASTPCAMDLGRLLVYKRALSTADRALVLAALKAEWGV